jgi:Protein of unknown function (DUF1552)
MRPRHALTRRKLLQSTGLAAGTLFLPSLLSGRAAAQAAPPKRIIVFFTQHGTVYPNWRMRPQGQGDSEAFTAELAPLAQPEFSQILQPLHAMRQKLTVLDGLAMASAEADELINEHTKGTAHALTGARMQDETSAGGKSIDQLIADHIALEGRRRSLELAIIRASSGGAVYQGAGQALPPDTDPTSTVSRVFPADDGPDEEAPVDPMERVQSSILDLVADEYERLAPRLSGEDRDKLEAHLNLVREAEVRTRELQLLSCERPTLGALENNFATRAYYDTRFTAMASVITAALACDLTRVVTLQLDQLTSEHCGVGSADIHAEYAHQQDVEPGATVMTTYGRVHAAHFAELLAMLDAVPEGNGTLLDNTVVVWCGELATGTHKFTRWPVVIGGGGNLGLQTGRYHRYPATVPTPNQHPEWQGVDPLIGPPHNRMWMRVAELVGAPLEKVGDETLTTTTGTTIDCTEPLDF